MVSHIFDGVNKYEEIRLPANGDGNTFIYMGTFYKNDITARGRAMFCRTVDNDLSYFLSYIHKPRTVINRRRPNKFPEDIQFILLGNTRYYTVSEAFCFFLFYVLGLDCRLSRNGLKRFYQREFRRHFSGMDFDTFIHFYGYSNHLTGMLAYAEGKRIIFANNNIKQNASSNNKMWTATLRLAYSSYDRIVVETEELIYPIRELLGKSATPVSVVYPIIDSDMLADRAALPIKFQKWTLLFCADPMGLQHFIDTWNNVFISIGNFTSETRYDLLIDAFESICKTHNDLGLIIIGKNGKAYKKILEKIVVSDYRKHIALIRNIENPLPILKQCSLFVLPSNYEGLPVYLLEAACLRIPVISTDCTVCNSFLKTYGGHIVECSTEGLVEGMEEFLEKGFSLLDYEKYAADSRHQQESLLT